jgi:hypothetical protein
MEAHMTQPNSQALFASQTIAVEHVDFVATVVRGNPLTASKMTRHQLA